MRYFVLFLALCGTTFGAETKVNSKFRVDASRQKVSEWIVSHDRELARVMGVKIISHESHVLRVMIPTPIGNWEWSVDEKTSESSGVTLFSSTLKKCYKGNIKRYIHKLTLTEDQGGTLVDIETDVKVEDERVDRDSLNLVLNFSLEMLQVTLKQNLDPAK